MPKKNPFTGIVEKLVPHLHNDMSASFKFDKSVDTGPLPQEADPETQQTLQDERIRRQVQSHVFPKNQK